MPNKDVIQLAISVIAGVAGPFVAVWLSLKQFRSQKWWERQEQTYTVLLASLSFIQFCSTQEYNKFRNQVSYYTLTKADVNRLKLSRQNLQELRMSGGYIISDKTAAAVNEFLQIYDFDEWDDPEKHLNAVNECINIVKDEAIGALDPARFNFFQQLKTWTDGPEPPASNVKPV
jgi:hypothetical protein